VSQKPLHSKTNEFNGNYNIRLRTEKDKNMEYGKLIGIGNTATVYEWGDDKVLKVFLKDYPKESIDREFQNALSIREMDFGKPKAYKILDCDGCQGILYDKIEGESLLDILLRTSDLQKSAEIMADLHKQILKYKVSNVPDYKEFLSFMIKQDVTLDEEKRDETIQLLNKLPAGDTLCHGDFHPGNIILKDDNAVVIDFMNVCHGNYLYDVARTVYLVEYTPVPDIEGDIEKLLYLKKTLADLYLKQMNVTREMISDYLPVIDIARRSE
jgi:uncharacterized protein (TIGR02172 family)